jgi:ARG and Rhodanese-Phosphatase-superfamily-associated Protein domain
MNPLGRILSRAGPAPPKSFQNLSMFPLLSDHGRPSRYLTLDEALVQGCVTVTEVSQPGAVPEIAVVSRFLGTTGRARAEGIS